MPNYKQMYFELAAKVADAIDLLVLAQQQGEAHFCEDTPPAFTLSPPESKEAEP